VKNAGDFQNNGITLKSEVVITLHWNQSYTLEHYYLPIDNEPQHWFKSKIWCI